MISIILTPESDINDRYALAIVEYNLGNYDTSIKILTVLIQYKPELVKLLAIAKLTLIRNNINYQQSEESILDEYFKSSIKLEERELTFSFFLNSIFPTSYRFVLKREIKIQIKYLTKENLHWSAGPFSHNAIIQPYVELNKARNMQYYFERHLQNLILNDDYNEEHHNFLKSFLTEESSRKLISEYSSSGTMSEREYTGIQPLNV